MSALAELMDPDDVAELAHVVGFMVKSRLRDEKLRVAKVTLSVAGDGNGGRCILMRARLTDAKPKAWERRRE